jgi:hypothetical protein
MALTVASGSTSCAQTLRVTNYLLQLTTNRLTYTKDVKSPALKQAFKKAFPYFIHSIPALLSHLLF